jgi:hypothetical protein
MSLAEAIVRLDVVVLLAFLIDFAVWSRTSTSVVARAPILIVAIAIAFIGWLRPGFRPHLASLEFIAIAALVIGSAWFGYTNFLAFVKRGITFSILHNHARPPEARRPDRDFIALEDRLAEMHGHGWIARTSDRWALTASGRRVVRMRRLLLRLLRIEAVG